MFTLRRFGAARHASGMLCRVKTRLPVIPYQETQRESTFTRS